MALLSQPRLARTRELELPHGAGPERAPPELQRWLCARAPARGQSAGGQETVLRASAALCHAACNLHRGDRSISSPLTSAAPRGGQPERLPGCFCGLHWGMQLLPEAARVCVCGCVGVCVCEAFDLLLLCYFITGVAVVSLFMDLSVLNTEER